jgi:crotonobetainyl-CoA:carnitine CoA-transferase CaiB-like acyl-CoA transferase
VSGPLDGLLVVAVEQAVAAPYCTGRLADAGARVIKVERPEGDFARRYDHVVHGESAYFAWLNRGKQSVALDFKRAGDAALLRRMIARADVLVQNLAPGALARAGFDPDALHAESPRLITCSISGYGEEGEYRDMPAYDLLVQAETGLCAVTGTPDAPGRVGVSVCDIAAGMYAYQAILEAVIERGNTGRGKALSVSLFDGMADWMAVPLLHHDYGGRAPERVGIRHPSIAPYAAFATGDGARIVISIQNEREWARFAADIMGRPEWASEPPYDTNVSRVAHRDALEAEIAAVFARFTAAEMTKRLRATRIAFGRLNDVAGLSGHPALRRVTVGSPSGPIDLPAPPARAADEAPALGAIPGLDEHGAAIRAEFAAPEKDQR